VTTFDQAIKADKLDGDAAFRKLTLKNVDFEGEAYVQFNKPSPPPWLTFVRDFCDIESPETIFNQSNSFLLLLRANTRIFAVATGQGFTAINREGLEPEFGIKVVLNAVATDKLKSVQSRKLDSNPVQKYQVSSREGKIGVFDVDFFLDLLARMEGVPQDAKLGKRVEGAESCGLTSDVTFPRLAKKCGHLYRYFNADTYKTTFPEYDAIRPLHDKSKISALNKRLAAQVNKRAAGAFALALPDIALRGDIHHFKLAHPNCGAGQIDDLLPEGVFKYLTEEHVTECDVEGLTVIGVNGDGNPASPKVSFYRCAIFETVLRNKTYVLTLGKWYEVQTDYVKFIDDWLAFATDGKVINAATYLPTYLNRHKTEGDYNLHAAAATGFVCMDKQCAPIRGHSRIEVCDLFSPADKSFIHVKRGTRSSTASHLFAQGSVSATLFCDSPEYRRFVSQTLADAGHDGIVDVTKASCSDYNVVFAVTAADGFQFPTNIPFFSKVNLLHHQRIVDRLGFDTRFFAVPVEA
jgi:uncharacterized protein (TIGR04141 family)